MSKTKYASAIIILPDSRLLIHSLAGSYYEQSNKSELTVETHVTAEEVPYIEIIHQLKETLGIEYINKYFNLRYSFKMDTKTKLGLDREVHLFFLQQKAQCQFKVKKPNALDILTIEHAFIEKNNGRLKLGLIGSMALNVVKNMFDNNLSN